MSSKSISLDSPPFASKPGIAGFGDEFSGGFGMSVILLETETNANQAWLDHPIIRIHEIELRLLMDCSDDRDDVS